MDDDALGRLFRAFQQADKTVHRTHGGTGLGLSISKALVELWGGRIYARSQLGECPPRKRRHHHYHTLDTAGDRGATTASHDVGD